MKINVVGNIFGNDGYSSHTRNLFNALYKITDVKLNTQLIPDWMRFVNDAELNAITKPERKEDWNIIVTIPHMWKLFLGQGKNACYCVWEGDKVPVSWIDDFLNPKVNLILVPSKHTEKAIWNTIGNVVDEYNNTYISTTIYEKIKVIPHGVDTSIFYSQRKKDATDAQISTSGDTKQEQGKTIKTEHVPVNVDNHADTFKFICNKGWRGTTWDRGGVQYLLKAFAEEFNKDEKVELIIKLNPAYINPQIISSAIQQLNLPENRAKIQIISDILPQNKLRELYNSADCFVCATRCEAFNLPGLEAMACGLPNIQTAFGGQIDYMTQLNSLFIDYDLSESEEKPMYEGINWAIPKIESLRKQLRWAFENQEKIKEKGKQAEEDSKKWTWDSSAKKIMEIIK